MEEDLKDAMRQIIAFASDNAASISKETKMQAMQMLEALGAKLEQLQAQGTEERTEEVVRILWQSAAGKPEVFVNYLRQYPDPSLSQYQNNPAALAQLIKRLQKEMPQGKYKRDKADGMQESWLPSSNVFGFKYDPNNQRLVVKFNGKTVKAGGPIYLYDGVPPAIAKIFMAGAVPAKTTGKNRYGSWWKGKNPSLGAASNALLKKGPFAYQRVA